MRTREARPRCRERELRGLHPEARLQSDSRDPSLSTLAGGPVSRQCCRGRRRHSGGCDRASTARFPEASRPRACCHASPPRHQATRGSQHVQSGRVLAAEQLCVTWRDVCDLERSGRSHLDHLADNAAQLGDVSWPGQSPEQLDQFAGQRSSEPQVISVISPVDASLGRGKGGYPVPRCHPSSGTRTRVASFNTRPELAVTGGSSSTRHHQTVLVRRHSP
jgi:hypothetical protein